MEFELKCEDCGKRLTYFPDHSGKDLGVIVCFDCEPPKQMCRTCADVHAGCRGLASP